MHNETLTFVKVTMSVGYVAHQLASLCYIGGVFYNLNLTG